MVDFSVFDVLLDSIFVVDSDKKVIYCNEIAAALCGSSVRRLTRGKTINDIIQFSDENMWVNTPYPLAEVDYTLPESSKQGKLQVAIQPFSAENKSFWVLFARDVTIEEVLHAKHKKQLEQLENYSKNLEKMVEERTAELNTANRMLNAIMESLGQGFLVFDENGQCLDIYTRACEDILEKSPAGKSIITVLNCTGSDKDQFEMWLKTVFSESLPFETLKDLGPSRYKHSQGKFVTLDYFAIRSEENSGIQNVVLVATDKTSEHEANIALEKEKEYAKMIVKLVTHRKQFSNFLQGIPRHLSEVHKQVDQPNPDIDSIFRALHTLEGEAAAFSIRTIHKAARDSQDLITRLRDGQFSNFNEIKSEFLNALQLLHETFEQFKNDHAEILKIINFGEKDMIEITWEKVEELAKYFLSNGLSAPACKEFVNEMKRQSAKEGLYHYNHIVQQVAEKQGKKVAPIQFEGLETRIDLEIFEGVFSSLIHVFRNIVDHGLETPDERIDSGKPPEGVVRVKLERVSSDGTSYLLLQISDDGRGIDPKVIKKKLSQAVGIKSIAGESDHQVIQHIFDPGFSSRDSAGEFSGRGVGMDAVKTEVLKVGGEVEVFSKLGQGTQLKISLPEKVYEESLRNSA